MNLEQISRELIAPCGINCAVCYAFLRDKNTCPGCKTTDSNKPKHCQTCSILNCDELAKTNSGFCCDCSKYPCKRMKQLDKRYSLRYKMSNLNNLEMIKNDGIDAFLAMERIKWKCNVCGGTVCVHSGKCVLCKSEVSN